MLLSLLSSSRRLRILAVLLSLMVNISVPAFCGTISVTGVSGSCQAITAVWSDSGTNAMYMLMLVNGSNLLTQVVMGTSYTFPPLSPGNYTLTVTALGTSSSSPPYPFIVSCGPVCQVPVVAVTSVNPSILCRQHHGSIAVAFRGTITSACALSGVHYTLTDNFGSGSQGPVTVASDGYFAVNLMLATRHKGRVYTFTVSAMNSVGSTTSSPIRLDVQKCTHVHAHSVGVGESDDDHDD